MDDTPSLRRTIEALAANNFRRRYPAELRARVAAHARRELADGVTLWGIASSLGMGTTTLRRFLGDTRPWTLVPVKVLDAVPKAELADPIVVRGACGVTVEGLDIAGVAGLLRALS